MSKLLHDNSIYKIIKTSVVCQIIKINHSISICMLGYHLSTQTRMPISERNQNYFATLGQLKKSAFNSIFNLREFSFVNLKHFPPFGFLSFASSLSLSIAIDCIKSPLSEYYAILNCGKKARK
jgi:hypothetical protein